MPLADSEDAEGLYWGGASSDDQHDDAMEVENEGMCKAKSETTKCRLPKYSPFQCQFISIVLRRGCLCLAGMKLCSLFDIFWSQP